MNRRSATSTTKRPRKGSARENWDRAEADQARREKSGNGDGGKSKVRRTGAPPAARKRAVSATRETNVADQLRSPSSRITRRANAAQADVDGDPADADDEADDASDGSDTHGERRVEALQRAATMRGGGETASLVLVKWCSLPQVCAQ